MLPRCQVYWSSSSCWCAFGLYLNIFLQNWFTVNVFHYSGMPLAYIPGLKLCFCIEQFWITFVCILPISLFFSHFFIQFFEKNQVTYFVSSSCFFWKLFRMNYFMTILVFPKLFVFVLFLYVIRFRFSTWLLTILVALPLLYSSSKGDRLIRYTRLFGDVAFSERCEASLYFKHCDNFH